MSDIEVRPYSHDIAARWDELVDNSVNGTFMRTRRFLAYHGDRFDDRSMTVWQRDKLVGVVPAAVSPSDPSIVASHPGLSYGGLVRRKGFSGEPVVSAFEALRSHWADEFDSWVHKPVPDVYHRRPSADEAYALFRLGADRHRCDISAAIRLEDTPGPNSNRRRLAKRADAAGVEISTDLAHLPRYWEVLSERLADAHDAAPVHSLDEITMLAEWFPAEIRLVVALLDGDVVAGTVLFDAPTCTMAQYIGSSESGRAVSALDPVFAHCVDEARANGRLWYNFGTCNEDAGWTLNQSLLDYKLSYGAGVLVQEQFTIPLG